MDLKLEWSEVETIVPDNTGTKHGFHCKRGKGNDKLYVTRKPDGDVVAFCHHCGAKGGWRVGDKLIGTRTAEKAHESFKGLPRDLVEDFVKFPPEAQTFIQRWGIDANMVEEYSIGYSPASGRIVYPVYDGLELIGYEARSVKGEEPKCLQYKKDFSVPMTQCWNYSVNPTNYIIVEDYLSGIRVSNAFKDEVGVIVNFGTQVTVERVKRWKEAFPNAGKAFLFFDNDNIQVKRKQLDAKKLIELVHGIPCEVVTSNKDPKAHTDAELMELIV